MSYTTVRVHAEKLAAKLAQTKVEKKWEALGWSPYIETTFGLKYTENAEVDYEKHYDYFLKVISEVALSIETKINKELKEVFKDE